MKIVTFNTKKTTDKERYKEWSIRVRTRDNYECQICRSTERSNAHHIIPRQIKEWTFDVDNGITLCVKHHKFSRVCSAHNNPLAFFLWLADHNTELFIIACDRNTKMKEGLAKREIRQVATRSTQD